MSTPELDVESKNSASGSAKALVKGLTLVDMVAGTPGPARLVDLVAASGMPRPTVLRLLDALCKYNVLQVDENGGYLLGARLASWGEAFLDRLDLRAQAADLMRELVGLSDETCFLAVRDGRHILYVAVENSPQPVRPAARVGHRNPLHSTGIGKAMLAHLPPAVVDELLALPLERRTENTVTDPDGVRELLDGVRARGYAVDDVENEEGVRCVAAPVRDHTGAVVAGLSVSAPAYRFSSQDLADLGPAVVDAARRLSARLGHLEPGASPNRPTPPPQETAHG